jgi:hypothetical protein
MDKQSPKKAWSERAKIWIVRFIKFNIIGTAVFLVGTAIYGVSFPTFGAWTWLIANSVGSISQFSLVSYFNKKKRGVIFDKCESN